MKATALKATRVKTSDAAALDVMVDPSDCIAGFKRLDVAISRQSDGHLRISLDVPAHLSASVAGLLAALGVNGGR
jgi:hypothetical protein